jgi:hypothetical protein
MVAQTFPAASVDFDRKFLELCSQPGSGFCPCCGERHTLSTVLVGGERPQLLELRERSLWVQAEIHYLAFSSSARIRFESSLFSNARMKAGLPSFK